MSNGLDTSRPELVFALVGAAGVRLDDLTQRLKNELSRFSYTTIDVRLSDLLPNYSGWTSQPSKGEFGRITHLQNMGNRFRNDLKDGAALARAGISRIRELRAGISGSPDTPASAHAYLVRQLKHPSEVDLLRRVYGSSFLLIAGHAPEDLREVDLSKRMADKDMKGGQFGKYRSDAAQAINADEKQEDDFGQNTRDTYPKADFFVNLGIDQGESELERFVDLLFGHPFRTPTPEEYAMYQASAAALRSSDYSRQVGAAIVSLSRDLHSKIRNADVIAVGMNEVPRGGGGYYWEKDSPDSRDQALLRRGDDRAAQIKVSALSELLQRIINKRWLRDEIGGKDANDLAVELLPDLKRTQFMDIGEFSRPVHAETSALIDAARRGVAVDGHSMYVTTFPCHNCAKHIIAAGLSRVIYLEPYPKSRATHLYAEELALDSRDGRAQEGKVVFAVFSGVAPRQYRQLFSMSERGTKQGLSLQEWETSRSQLVPLHVPKSAFRTSLAEERRAMETLDPAVYDWDRKKICP